MLEYTKQEMIAEIAKRLDLRKADVNAVFELMEEITVTNLQDAKSNQEDACIKLFPGIRVEGKFVSKHNSVNRLTGIEETVQDKLRLSCKMTKAFKNKINFEK